MVESNNQRRAKEYNTNKTKFLENYRLTVNSKKKHFLRVNENRIISRTYTWNASPRVSCQVSNPNGKVPI